MREAGGAVEGAGPGTAVRRVQRRATIKDVAEAAGVSRSTASRALNGHGYVGSGVRERVMGAADALGYVPDDMARHLKQRVSRSVGVLVSDLRTPFYADVAAGVGLEARRRGFAMVLADDCGDPAGEVEAARRFVALRVAGVVVTPTSAQIGTFLARQRVPVVEVERHFGGGSTDAVVVDNAGAAREVTEHLLELGHRRIGLLLADAGWSSGRDRRAGYEQACRAAGLAVDDSLVVACPPGVAAAQERAIELLRRPGAPTAVLAAGAASAEGAWRAASALGLRVPDDLSLASCDDAAWMGLVTPGVTAVEQDAAALGAAALTRLLERIDAPAGPVGTVVLGYGIRHRGSTAPPPGRDGTGRDVRHAAAHPGQDVL